MTFFCNALATAHTVVCTYCTINLLSLNMLVWRVTNNSYTYLKTFNLEVKNTYNCMCTKVDLQIIIHCNLITWSTNGIKRTTCMNDHTDLSSCWKSRHNYTLQNCLYAEKLTKNSTWNKNKPFTWNCMKSCATYFCKFWQRHNQQEIQDRQTAPNRKRQVE